MLGFICVNILVGVANFVLLNKRAKSMYDMDDRIQEEIDQIGDPDYECNTFMDKVISFFYGICEAHPFIALILLVLFYSIPVFNVMLLAKLLVDLRG